MISNPGFGYTVVSVLILSIFIFIIVLIWLYYRIDKRANDLFQTWKNEEFDRLHTWLMQEAETRAQLHAKSLFNEWLVKEEQNIRQDAVKRSHSVLKGKITEHLIPYFSEFPFNPSDARFLGSPVDFIVFDGLSEGELKQVVFVEVKTGSGTLSPRERSIARTVQDKEDQISDNQKRIIPDIDFTPNA